MKIHVRDAAYHVLLAIKHAENIDLTVSHVLLARKAFLNEEVIPLSAADLAERLQRASLPQDPAFRKALLRDILLDLFKIADEETMLSLLNLLS